MITKFFTFEQIHNKRNVGSTRLRVHNLIKHWDEASLYRYGDKADVMVYQKVYTTLDYKYQQHFKGIQILDICDPDFKDSPDVFIKETMDAMDAVVTPNEQFKDFLQQMTDTPVSVIKDRFDLSEFPKPKTHKDKLKTVCWFGYAHNAETLKYAIPSIERRGLKLLIVANEDPHAYRWAMDSQGFEKNYTFVKYEHPQVYKDIQKADVCIFPESPRPMDNFKSENKTVISQLLGIPVAKTADDLDSLTEANSRNRNIQKVYTMLYKEYDCKRSIMEYRKLINEIAAKRN